jgi:hypothetical protein
LAVTREVEHSFAPLARWTGGCPTWDYLERSRPLVVRYLRLIRTSRARAVAGAIGVTVAVLGGASWYQACSVYNASLLGSANVDSLDGDLAGDGGIACIGAVPPSGPQNGEGGGGGNLQVVAAFRTIDIGVTGGLDASVPPFGYNLDKDCTCPGPPSCVNHYKGAPAETCDDEAGRDNTDIQLFRLLGGTASTGTSQIDQGLTSGQYSLLLVINNYNGQSDDSLVTVDFYVSNGLNRTADGGIPTPQFNGNDLWTIDPGSLSGGQPAFTDDQAYVSGGTLVAHMTQLPIAFGARSFLGGATMQLLDAVIVGQLAGYNIDGGPLVGFALVGGTIAGRWPTAKILSTLATIPVDGGGFLCGSSSSAYTVFDYNVIKTVVCQNADISKNISTDNQVPLAPCDAISVGMQFTAVPAQLGEVLPVPPAPSGCEDDAGNPWSDTCSQ